MNLKLLGCIAMGVFVAHLALFMMVFGLRTSRHGSAAVAEAPNLHMAEQVVMDPATKTKVVNREITVSTRLRPEVYQGKADQTVRR